MRVLLDSNIVLDIILARVPFVWAAVEISRLAICGRISCYITASNVTDIFYLAQKALSNAEARAALKNLFNIFRILPVREKECIAALDAPNPDFEDAVLEACANTCGLDYIITRDKAFLDRSNLTITPLDFLLKF